MKVVIDRFEGNFAVCVKDDKTIVNLEKSKLPDNVKEGDVLVIDGNIITVDTEETQKRKQKIEKLMNDIWKKTIE